MTRTFAGTPLPVVPLPFTATVESWTDTVRVLTRGFFDLHGAEQLECMLFLLVPVDNTPLAGQPDVVVNDDNETMLVLHLPFTGPHEKAEMLDAAREAAAHLGAKATAIVSEATIRGLDHGSMEKQDIVVLHSETPGHDAQTAVANILTHGTAKSENGTAFRALAAWNVLNESGIRVEGAMTGFLPKAAVTPPSPRRHSKGPAVTPTGAFTWATRRTQGPSA